MYFVNIIQTPGNITQLSTASKTIITYLKAGKIQLHEIMWLTEIWHIILNCHGLHTNTWFSVILHKTNNCAHSEVHVGKSYIAQKMIHFNVISTFVRSPQCRLYPARLRTVVLLDDRLAQFASWAARRTLSLLRRVQVSRLLRRMFHKESF